MELQLKGRNALVTGASMGIGRAIAKGLAAEGVKVAIVARRRELLDTLAEEIVRAEGPRPVIIVADVMAADAAARIGGEALAGLGAVDILINSAGGSRRSTRRRKPGTRR
jgi:3-oxoacyl-[acyl-carrier protein] reductase